MFFRLLALRSTSSEHPIQFYIFSVIASILSGAFAIRCSPDTDHLCANLETSASHKSPRLRSALTPNAHSRPRQVSALSCRRSSAANDKYEGGNVEEMVKSLCSVARPLGSYLLGRAAKFNGWRYRSFSSFPSAGARERLAKRRKRRIIISEIASRTSRALDAFCGIELFPSPLR